MRLNYLLYWLPMVALAFVNAAIREFILMKQFNLIHAQQLSGLTLTILCAIYIWLIFSFLKITDALKAFSIGLFWVIFTVAFEFTLGRLTKHSWQSLLYEYNIPAGKIWPFFLLCLFFLPYLIFLIRGEKRPLSG